jgi:hypothetical protein
MAQAIAKYLDTSGPGAGVSQTNTYAVTFFGTDVPADIATGEQQYVTVEVPTSYDYTALRDLIVAAVIALAATFGITVAENDVLSPNFSKMDDIIYDSTLTVATASITTPPIPQRYRNLEISFSGRSTAVADKTNVRCQLNGDTSALYFSQVGYFVGGGAGAVEIFSGNSLFVGQASGTLAPTSCTGFCIVDLHNYTETNWYQTFYSRWGVIVTDVSAGMFAGVADGRYRSLGAITSATLLLDAGNFDVGTRITVRGIS